MYKILIIALVIILFGTLGFVIFKKYPSSNSSSQILCATDAKVCPDGSAVGRDGPKCEFAACPEASLAPMGSEIVVSGTMICLPHKNTSGPQTLECAFGLKGDDGKNYALGDPEWKFLIGVGNGTKVEIQGEFVPGDDGKFNSAGSITIKSLREI